MDIKKLEDRIFAIKSLSDFNDLALQIFYFQYKNNAVYQNFIDLLKIDIRELKNYTEIPCLPVEFFKTHTISSVSLEPELIFFSSGTSSQIRSKSLVYSKSLYETSIYKTFCSFYGSPEEYIITALIPNNPAIQNSSLVYMLDFLIKRTKNSLSGFYFEREEKLLDIINNKQKTKIILFGITYALLRFAENNSFSPNELTLIETGGMKGKMKEITRDELHSKLVRKLKSPIHSEYSMAEIMSQAYSLSNGVYLTPPWMHVRTRDVYDPLSCAENEKSGGIDIIDLANIYTCSFISTKDIGILHENLTFEVLGRFDFSDLRGCNLMQTSL